MQKIDSIIEQIKLGIKKQEMLISKENPKTDEGQKKIYFYQCRIAELEYRIKELEENKKGNTSIAPIYGDGKYATDMYKESFDMLRVWYYNHFHQEPIFKRITKRYMMFYDSTLWMPVYTYFIKGEIPFQIMFSYNYSNHKSDNTISISIELPFEILSKEENKDYLQYMLELIKIYSGSSANLVLGNSTSTQGSLSFIADRDLSSPYGKNFGYYDFFDRLCDNITRNIIYIGDSMKMGIKPETVDKVKNNFVEFHKRIIATEVMTKKELEQSNEKIKKRILSINNQL